MDVVYSRRGRMRPALGVFMAPVRVRRVEFHCWSWMCQRGCWATVTSGWSLPSQRAALDEALAHLLAWHKPEPCRFGGDRVCAQRHVKWPILDPAGLLPADSFVWSHPDDWKPLSYPAVAYAA
jgi:hypothetical protein